MKVKQWLDLKNVLVYFSLVNISAFKLRRPSQVATRIVQKKNLVKYIGLASQVVDCDKTFEFPALHLLFIVVSSFYSFTQH